MATFSIVARDPATGEIGVAVQSKFIAVGAVVPWARAGVGAVATQAWGNPTFGPRGLDLLSAGLAPKEVLERLLADDRGREKRQVGILDASGRAAIFTGKECQDWAGGVVGKDCACQGNILAGEGVVRSMARAFEEAKGDLGDRMIAALEAGQGAGGDRRGMQSAALLVVRERGGYGGFWDRYRDLRVDDHPDPIAELKRIYALHRQVFPPPPR